MSKLYNRIILMYSIFENFFIEVENHFYVFWTFFICQKGFFSLI